MKETDHEINRNIYLARYLNIFLGVLCLASLAFIGFVRELSLPVQIGFLVIAVISLTLVFLDKYEEISSTLRVPPFIWKIEGKKPKVFRKNVQGKHKNVEAVVALESPLKQFSDVSDAEQRRRNEISEILGNESNPDKIQDALNVLLAPFESTVKTSFRYPLNIARFLALLGRLSEAEKAAQDVLKNYADNKRAIAEALQVLALVEFSREPDKNDAILYRNWIITTKALVNKGLEYDSNFHPLLMNAFEISVLENNGKEAENFLKRAYLSSKDKTQGWLTKLTVLQQAKSLGSELSNMIQEIINGEFNMNVEPDTNFFEVLRRQTFLFILIAVIAFLLLTLSYRVPVKVQGQISIPEAAGNLVKINNDFAFLAKLGGGTEVTLAQVFLGKTDGGGGTEVT